MNDAISTWHIYKLNDCDYWVARSLDEAMHDAAMTWGSKSAEEAETDGLFDDPYQLTYKEMSKLMFVDNDEDESPISKSSRSFRAELSNRVKAGISEPGLFASTEY